MTWNFDWYGRNKPYLNQSTQDFKYRSIIMQDDLAVSPQLAISSLQLWYVLLDILFESDCIPKIKSCSNKVYLVTLKNDIFGEIFLKICNARLLQRSKSEICIWVEKTLLKSLVPFHGLLMQIQHLNSGNSAMLRLPDFLYVP